MQEVPTMGILIRRPVQEVFDCVMDIEKTTSWRPRMSEVHWITEEDPGLGSRFQVVVRSLGSTFDSNPKSSTGTRPIP